MVLGGFVGIFAYCIVVLRTIRGGEEAAFVPSLAALGGILLALGGIAMLIFFVHHIATTLDASEIISRITHETLRAVDHLLPEELEQEFRTTQEAAPALLAAAPPDAWRPVPSRWTGHIQGTDLGGLVGVARGFGSLVRLERTAGDFVARGRPLARFAPHPRRLPPKARAAEWRRRRARSANITSSAAIARLRATRGSGSGSWSISR